MNHRQEVGGRPSTTVRSSIDPAQVNGRVFVNNASMAARQDRPIAGVPRCQARTVIECSPICSARAPSHSTCGSPEPDGADYRCAQLVLVSNNPYELDPVGPRHPWEMNHGTLGVVVAARRITVPPMEGWTTPSFEVNSASTIETGVDGEALALDPPLRFEVLPSSLRIRVPFAGVSRAKSLRGRSHPIPGPLDGDEGSKKLPSVR